MASSLGIAVVGILLSLGGYVAHSVGGQPPQAIRAIALIWALFPAFSYTVAVLLIARYRPIVATAGDADATDVAMGPGLDASLDRPVG